MTPEQIAVFRAALLAETDPELVGYRTNGQTPLIVRWYQRIATPDFWVWRTDVTRAELYHGTSPDGTTWNWTTYKQQQIPEQNAWTQMFMGDTANFALPNLRAGVAAIFSGVGAQAAQRDHCLSMGRRLASRIEKMFATGAGTSVSPATAAILSFTDADVNKALNDA